MKKILVIALLILGVSLYSQEVGNWPENSAGYIEEVQIVDGWIGFNLAGKWFAIEKSGIIVNPEDSFKNLYSALLFAKSTKTKIHVYYHGSKTKWGSTYYFVQIIYIKE